MSAKLTGKVWELALDRAQQVIALALADHGDDDGSSIYPSVGRVAWKTGYSERQVQRIIAQLVDVGLLVKVAEAVGHRPTEYQMNTSAIPDKPPFKPRGDTVSPRQNVAPTSEAGRGDISDARGDIQMSPEPSKETSSESEERARARKTETDPDAIALCRVLAVLIREHDPAARLPTEGTAARDGWVREMRLLVRDRGGDTELVERVIRWCQADSFWQSNILSPAKLRKQFTALLLRMNTEAIHPPAAAGRPMSAAGAKEQRTAERMARLQAARAAESSTPQPQIEGGSNVSNHHGVG